MANKSLFKITEITRNGVALAFADGSAELTGAAGFENEVVPSASGDDYYMGKRVARQLKAKIQFAQADTPDEISQSGAEFAISFKDRQPGNSRRGFAPRCVFASMGPVGQGAVDVTFNILAPVQWL